MQNNTNQFNEDEFTEKDLDAVIGAVPFNFARDKALENPDYYRENVINSLMESSMSDNYSTENNKPKSR